MEKRTKIRAWSGVGLGKRKLPAQEEGKKNQGKRSKSHGFLSEERGAGLTREVAQGVFWA